jgi:hypothetical protein
MKARRRSRIVTGMSFMYSANTQRRGQRIPRRMSECERQTERELVLADS